MFFDIKDFFQFVHLFASMKKKDQGKLVFNAQELLLYSSSSNILLASVMHETFCHVSKQFQLLMRKKRRGCKT